jgi:ribulose-phosphate 3-epimerase
MRVIPTIFAENEKVFKERFSKIVGISDRVQIDFMDGKFVPSKSVDLMKIPDLNLFYNKNPGKKKNTLIEFEGHFMVLHPKNYVELASKKGFNRFIFHYESLALELDIKYLIALIRRNKMIPVLALNPETPVEAIYPFLYTISHVLLMGVNPGKEGQKFLPDTIKKIKDIKKANPSIIIQIDGGINETIARKIFKSGADFINSGSLVANSTNPKTMLKKLEVLK